MSRGWIAIAMLGVGLCACDAPPRPLSWEVTFADGVPSDARVLEAEIREGGCGGDAIYSVEIVLDGDPPEMTPPELEPGLYGFAVAARDAACARYAEGCVMVELPQAEPAPLVVELEAIEPAPACSAARCQDGACVDPDAGPPPDSGGVDAGTRDAGPPPCPTGMADCNADPADACETVLGTVDDCGACGLRCRLDHASAACESDACAVVGCDEGWSNCDGDPQNGCEVSLRTLTDCGACGMGCSLSHAVAACAEGRCALVECHPGWANCDGVESNGCERSIRTATDCGACDADCSPLTPFCVLSPTAEPRCALTCPAEAPTGCGSLCVATGTDPDHCGACNTPCSIANGAPACAASACGIGACDPLWGDCDGSAGTGCETPLTTTAACGACGTPCASPSGLLSCATGACQVDACVDGLADCDLDAANGCEADLGFPSFCGSCETACSGDAPLCGVAASGDVSCLADCEAPAPMACEGRCVDTGDDPENCGGCGLVCVLPEASAACFEGACRVIGCTDGLGNCDGDDANGCETPLASTPAHCGECGVACPTPPHTEASCVDGECGIECASGFGDCDGDAENGCEQELSTIAHCGACDRACDPINGTGTCTATGTCQIESCNDGFDDCDRNASTGCEANLGADRSHCGACGTRCIGGNRDCCGGTCGSC